MRSTSARADVLRMAGRRDEADAALTAAIELYERKGNRSSAVAARTLLASPMPVSLGLR